MKWLQVAMATSSNAVTKNVLETRNAWVAEFDSFGTTFNNTQWNDYKWFALIWFSFGMPEGQNAGPNCRQLEVLDC